MNIAVYQGDTLKEPAAFVVIGICEDEPLPRGLEELIEDGDFRGKPKQMALLYPRGAVAPRRVLLLGLGKRVDVTVDKLCQMAAHAVKKAQELKVQEMIMDVPSFDTIAFATVTQALVEGTQLGQYAFLRHKTNPTDDETHRVERVSFLVGNNLEESEQGMTVGRAVSDAVLLARDLSNEPGNTMTPAHMAEAAREIAEFAKLDITVLGRTELEQQGFGGLLAVSQGSTQPPRFIMLEYGAGQESWPTICLVGKGITFDTGGISIKPADKMHEMKHDMSGAAAVLGTMMAVGQLRLPLHVVGLVSAAENMPGANAYKPGDVVKTLSGKTVEVLNTDAEGRIVLADALFFAQRYRPDAIIDLATLTGAIVVALGPHAIGAMGNNQPLIDRVVHAGEATLERVWQLPLWEEYQEMLKSDVADLKNIGGRPAGSITAAAFLSSFVGEYPWVHLDIAGTAWTDKPQRSYQTVGATGIGVRLLVQMLRDWSHS